jgi:hypothetical protein
MMYLQKSFTVPAAPKKIMACERCVYGSGQHAPWCPEGRCICGAPCSPGQKCFNCGYTKDGPPIPNAHFHFTDETGYCSICQRRWKKFKQPWVQ